MLAATEEIELKRRAEGLANKYTDLGIHLEQPTGDYS